MMIEYKGMWQRGKTSLDFDFQNQNQGLNCCGLATLLATAKFERPKFKLPNYMIHGPQKQFSGPQSGQPIWYETYPPLVADGYIRNVVSLLKLLGSMLTIKA